MIIRHGRAHDSWKRCLDGMYTYTMMVSALLLTVMVTGCSQEYGRHLQQTQAAVERPAAAVQYPVLAGTWEYEESGNTILITLNEYGNGTYRWKDGRFLTTAYSNGVWKGFWSQRENDRDGEFEVTLSEDRAEGTGRWWYTRIGSDTAPTHAGGVFQMARQSGSELPEPHRANRVMGSHETRDVRSRAIQ